MVKTPEMFEKFLPFAMALGVEDNWAKAFEGIYKEPPSWYSGPGGVHMFRPCTFTNNLGVMSTQPRRRHGFGAAEQRRIGIQRRLERRWIRRRRRGWLLAVGDPRHRL